MNVKIKRHYNEKAREGIERVREENGVMLKFIAKKADIEYTTFSKWRNRVFDFKEDKLIQIEKVISTYQWEIKMKT